MNAVRKINRSRTGRKILHITRRGKYIYLIREQIEICLDGIHELLVIRRICLPFEDLSEPA